MCLDHPILRFSFVSVLIQKLCQKIQALQIFNNQNAEHNI